MNCERNEVKVLGRIKTGARELRHFLKCPEVGCSLTLYRSNFPMRPDRLAANRDLSRHSEGLGVYLVEELSIARIGMYLIAFKVLLGLLIGLYWSYHWNSAFVFAIGTSFCAGVLFAVLATSMS